MTTPSPADGLRECLACAGRGYVGTGITEAPTTICDACDGIGVIPAPPTADDLARILEEGE